MVKRLLAAMLVGLCGSPLLPVDDCGLAAYAVTAKAGDDETPRQRRKRPGSMTHTEAEVQNAKKITKVQARYIRDNSLFSGDVYMVGVDGGIKVGDATMSFRGGRYYFGFESAEFDMREASTRDERMKKGISEYAYEHSWKKEKLGQDFQHSGKYEVVEQYGKTHLILYDGDSDNVFAKIPLSGANDSSFELSEDNFLFRMSHVR